MEVHDLATGAISARFVYTSRGTEGWGVAARVGDPPEAVVRSALTHIERLSEPETQGSPLGHRKVQQRRLFWAGERGSQWRFLGNTVTAGDDSSRRPNNNVTDCLVIAAAPDAKNWPPGSALWSGRNWLTPYGAREVEQLGADSWGAHPLTVDVDDLSSPLLLLIQLVCEANDPTLVYHVIELVKAVYEIASDARASTVVVVDDIDFAPIFLGAALSVIPFDTGWNTTYEIRNAKTAGSPNLHLVFVAEEPGVPALSTLHLGIQADFPQHPPKSRCSRCGEAIETWATIVARCLLELAEQAAGGNERESTALAKELVAYMSRLADQRVPSSSIPEHFSSVALQQAGIDRLPSLLPEAMRRSLDTDHSHPELDMPAPRQMVVESQPPRTEDLLRFVEGHFGRAEGIAMAETLAAQGKDMQKHWLIQASQNGAFSSREPDTKDVLKAFQLFSPYLARHWNDVGWSPALEGIYDQLWRSLLLDASEKRPSNVESLDRSIFRAATTISNPSWRYVLLDPERAAVLVNRWAFPESGRRPPNVLAWNWSGVPVGLKLTEIAVRKLRSGDIVYFLRKELAAAMLRGSEIADHLLLLLNKIDHWSEAQQRGSTPQIPEGSWPH